MEVKFLREGFANNSSSSHSIIFAGKNSTEDIEETFANDYGFGWDEFVVKTQYVKFVYAMNSIFSFIHKNHSAARVSYERGWNKDEKFRRLISEFDERLIRIYLDETIGFGRALNSIGKNSEFLTKYLKESHDNKDEWRSCYDSSSMGYVDHQSLISLPRMRDGESLNKRFAACFVKEIVEQNYVILGGNDNSETSHKGDYTKYSSDSRKNKALLKVFYFLKDNHDLIMAKYDEVAKHFVLSSKGGPIMFASFSNNLVGSELEG